MHHSIKIIGLAAAISMTTSVAFSATTLKFGHIFAPNSLTHQAVVKFAEKVEMDTNGEVKIKIFPAQQLGDERTMVESVMVGELDMTPTGPNFLGLIYPGMDVFELPYMYRSYDHLRASLKQYILPYASKQMAGQAHAIAAFTLGMRQMMSNGKEIHSMADLKGMKMRSPQADLPVRMWKAFGAAPTVVSYGEIYTALQTGLVDGCELPPVLAVESHLFESLKSLSRTDHLLNGVFVLMSEQAYGKLGKNAAAVEKAAEWAFTGWLIDENAARGEQAIAEMEKHGVKVVDPGNETRDALAASMTPILEEYIAKYPALKPTIDGIQVLAKK